MKIGTKRATYDRAIAAEKNITADYFKCWEKEIGLERKAKQKKVGTT